MRDVLGSRRSPRSSESPACMAGMCSSAKHACAAAQSTKGCVSRGVRGCTGQNEPGGSRLQANCCRAWAAAAAAAACMYAFTLHAAGWLLACSCVEQIAAATAAAASARRRPCAAAAAAAARLRDRSSRRSRAPHLSPLSSARQRSRGCGSRSCASPPQRSAAADGISRQPAARL